MDALAIFNSVALKNINDALDKLKRLLTGNETTLDRIELKIDSIISSHYRAASRFLTDASTATSQSVRDEWIRKAASELVIAS